MRKDMKNIWDKYLKGILFLYFEIYTVATLINSIIYLARGVYVPTMLLVFLYVFLRGLTVELAPTAYRDIFINYTAGFVFVSIVAFVISLIRKKKQNA